MPAKTELANLYVEVSEDERQAFLTGNSMPAGEAEGYIWFSFENSRGAIVHLFSDELTTAAAMARKAGQEALAARIEEGGSDVHL